MLKLYENIKLYRQQARMTQAELAKLTGYIDRSSIAKIEKGQVDLSQSKIEQFAEVFGVKPSDLMGWEYEDSPERDDKKEKPSETEGLSENHIKLIEFAKTVPEDKAEMILRVMRSIVEDGR